MINNIDKLKLFGLILLVYFAYPFISTIVLLLADHLFSLGLLTGVGTIRISKIMQEILDIDKKGLLVGFITSLLYLYIQNTFSGKRNEINIHTIFDNYLQIAIIIIIIQFIFYKLHSKSKFLTDNIDTKNLSNKLEIYKSSIYFILIIALGFMLKQIKK